MRTSCAAFWEFNLYDFRVQRPWPQGAAAKKAAAEKPEEQEEIPEHCNEAKSLIEKLGLNIQKSASERLKEALERGEIQLIDRNKIAAESLDEAPEHYKTAAANWARTAPPKPTGHGFSRKNETYTPSPWDRGPR